MRANEEDEQAHRRVRHESNRAGRTRHPDGTGVFVKTGSFNSSPIEREGTVASSVVEKYRDGSEDYFYQIRWKDGAVTATPCYLSYLVRRKGPEVSMGARLTCEIALERSKEIDALAEQVTFVLSRIHECGQEYWTGGDKNRDPGEQVDRPMPRESAAYAKLSAALDLIRQASHELVMHGLELPGDLTNRQ